ncbi:hypothetical protein H5410_027423 [Solanum commersonii]|uniref:Uncharacterized protein n=1 Tax=Solanum commersonii TaxID=4109 RepID=A0A9J5YZ38_SOLCO|nr:hypothetical protein H5410_027423 [Solanum commersonii]
MAHELGFEEEVVVDCDQSQFVSLRAQQIYYVDFLKKKLLSERGISLGSPEKDGNNLATWSDDGGDEDNEAIETDREV